MRKEPLFRHWTDLERVVPVVQSQMASNMKLTLVSLELYPGVSGGFIVTFNGKSIAPSARYDRGGRGWIRGHVVDQLGNRYSCS